ncbi:MAG: 4-hydroxy-tetrahydrodipicolinate synthase [Candidatus Limnocylindrales bacterium]|jgi:4-hydroxy-tetrahydrodipicolinate synthase
MPLNRQFRGTFTALVTPFMPGGAVDEFAFRALVRRQIDSAVDGLVLAATTGESPTLSPDEREWLFSTAVEIASERPSRSRIKVVANTGSNDTSATIRATRRAAILGADAAMCVVPYYNKPDQRMIEAHYRAIADDGALPIVVYNVPSRTGVNIEPSTLLRLAEHPRILAVKEASANMDQISTILRERPPHFSVLAGDDVWTLPMLAMGGDGVICTCANEIPGEMVAMCAAWFAGDSEAARRIHDRWLPLMKANFVGGPNPVPVKSALAMLGLISDVVRLPLLPLEEVHRARLRRVLETTGLLEMAQAAVADGAAEAESHGRSLGTTGGPGAARKEATRRSITPARA